MGFSGRPSSIVLHREFYTRKFIANFWSWGYLFTVIVILVTSILPFILTFSSGSKSALSLNRISILGEAKHLSRASSC